MALAPRPFAYTAGWFSPFERLTPTRLVDALAPAAGPSLGHRRNHAKGICFTGEFDANGAGAELSKAQVFLFAGSIRCSERFNLATADANAPDATVRVHGLGISITTPDGQEWRSAMIDAPIFAVSTPQGFYELLLAAKSKDADAMKNFPSRRTPEFAAFGDWAKATPPGPTVTRKIGSTASTASSSSTMPARSIRCAGRLCRRRSRHSISPADLAKRGPDYLEQEIAQRVAGAPQRWTLVVTVANPGDPTADPTKAWPPDRRTVEIGTLVVQKVEAEPNGPCRDINFDPTVLPTGIQTSDDPFPAARSAAYMKSYDLRTSEAQDYPRTGTGAKP